MNEALKLRPVIISSQTRYSYFSDKKGIVMDLSPAYFAMVMATGIVSIACHHLGMNLIAISLFWLNVFAYIILLILSTLRILFFKKEFFEDLFCHTKGVGFFTTVAGTCVLGSQFLILKEGYLMAVALWIVGIVLWVLFTYTIFTAYTIKTEKPPLEKGINGGWLLAVVSTQALAVLSAQLALHFKSYELVMNFFAFSMWLWGGMQYIWMIALIFYRYTFFKFSPGDLSPPYWISMGAMAISTLAGSLLLLNAPYSPFLLSTVGFIKGFTVFFWATGTWWIPMLVILACWRHLYKKFPLNYDPLYWGAVFPLGMYTVCTFMMAKAMNLDFLMPIPKYFIYAALVAWTLAFIGLIRKVSRNFFYKMQES